MADKSFSYSIQVWMPALIYFSRIYAYTSRRDKIAANGISSALLNNGQKYKCATQLRKIVAMQPGTKKITAHLYATGSIIQFYQFLFPFL